MWPRPSLPFAVPVSGLPLVPRCSASACRWLLRLERGGEQELRARLPSAREELPPDPGQQGEDAAHPPPAGSPRGALGLGRLQETRPPSPPTVGAAHLAGLRAGAPEPWLSPSAHLYPPHAPGCLVLVSADACWATFPSPKRRLQTLLGGNVSSLFCLRRFGPALPSPQHRA